jgi:hypothetical protein
LTELQERIILGVHPLPDGKPEEESLKLLVDLLLEGGAEPEPESDIVAQRWRKVLWWVLVVRLTLDRSLTLRKTQECGVFKLVHNFAC